MNKPVNTGIRCALIFGLSANPVHFGHIELVIGAYENLLDLGYNVAQILIIPVYRRNPVGNQKDDLPGTYEQRVSMCELAALEMCKINPNIDVSVSRLEAYLAQKSDNPNYTAETLTHLQSHGSPDLDLIFLISSELVSGVKPEFSQWYQTETILEVTSLAVCPRPGFCINQSYINKLTDNGGRFIILDNVQTPDISSAALRKRLQRGEDPLALAREDLIPLSIAQYHNEQELYQNNRTALKKTNFYHKNSI